MRVWESYFNEIRKIERITVSDKPWNQKVSYKNYLVSNPIMIGSPNGAGVLPGAATGWLDAIQKMGAWYSQNINTYQGGSDSAHKRARQLYDCPLINGKVADDCSGFVSACLKFFNIDVGDVHTVTMQPGSAFAKKLESSGFKYVPYDRNALYGGDIMVTNGSGHTSICGGLINGVQKFWDWGNNRFGKLPCGFIPSKYAHVWRYTGS